MIVGIDATNLNEGGGLTHLVEILSNVNIEKHNITKVIIWGREKTLSQIHNFPWLKKISPNELKRNLLSRLLWQKYKLSQSAIDNNCDLIFSPGSIFLSNFRPFVTMSQNMLPFESNEAKKYGLSLKGIRLILLRQIQSHAFKSSQGVIFLTNYAKERVIKVLGEISSSTVIIPHGVSPRFCIPPKEQFDKSEYSFSSPFKILYVSIIDHYKHQWNVVEAVAKLREEGYPVIVDFFGLSYLPAKKRLEKCIRMFDPNDEWAIYHGSAPYLELHNIYNNANLGVFASSCENLPIILLEKMASGLPIACSKKGPMPEILGNNGTYFNPEKPDEIYHSMKKIIDNVQLRSDYSNASFEKAQHYTWDTCALETFSFLEEVFLNYRKSA